MSRLASRYRVPLALSVALLAARLVSAVPLTDPLGAPLPPGLPLPATALYLPRRAPLLGLGRSLDAQHDPSARVPAGHGAALPAVAPRSADPEPQPPLPPA